MNVVPDGMFATGNVLYAAGHCASSRKETLSVWTTPTKLFVFAGSVIELPCTLIDVNTMSLEESAEKGNPLITKLDVADEVSVIVIFKDKLTKFPVLLYLQAP